MRMGIIATGERGVKQAPSFPAILNMKKALCKVAVVC